MRHRIKADDFNVVKTGPVRNLIAEYVEARRLPAAVREAHPNAKLRSTLRDLFPFVYSVGGR